MRVKKSELRKRLAQLPINYPAPEIVQAFDYEKEKVKVENLCRRLADNEPDVRDAVLAELPKYIAEVSARFVESIATSPTEKPTTRTLKQRRLLATGDDELSLVFAKLALGLFFCYWHSDKPLVQHSCAAAISKLIHYPASFQCKLRLLRSILRVLSKKWTTIDQWRIDKYMSLARKLLFEFLRCLQQGRRELPKDGTVVERETASPDSRKRPRDSADRDGTTAETSVTTTYSAILSEGVRIWQEEVVDGLSVGLTMQVADVFLDELLRSKTADTETFLELAVGIPLYIIQRGNHVEKRVVDNFFVPIASGRLEELFPAPTTSSKGATKMPALDLVRQLLQRTMLCSVDRSTPYAARPILVECQSFLEHYAKQREAPEQYEPINAKDKQIRVARAVEGAHHSAESREATVRKKLAKRAATTRAKRASGELKPPRERGKTRRHH